MIQKYGLYIVWVFACLGTLASLYLESPSVFDWAQRICLFPLVFIAGIAAWRGFLGISSYLLPQTCIGFFLALYQFLLGKNVSWVFSFSSEATTQPIVSFSYGALFFVLSALLTIISKKNLTKMVL